ncbi:hypothetical protein QAD02_000154 [Eretmocerus hayati]|uniref:Uncharacterized protein n=1 Tax=Eretmocerus hayati TaxID=131215 RepID=A0ACC2NH31_9HYME|nr:hypothetical protein QAD02_000154 [Eretmocerus hayati]
MVGRHQRLFLINYMERHRLFARRQIARLGKRGHQRSQEMWRELAMRLNRIGPAVRSVKQWSEYWTNTRQKSRLRVVRYMKVYKKTGQKKPKTKVSPEDLRVVKIFGRPGLGLAAHREAGFGSCLDPDQVPSWHKKTLVSFLQRNIPFAVCMPDSTPEMNELMQMLNQKPPLMPPCNWRYLWYWLVNDVRSKISDAHGNIQGLSSFSRAIYNISLQTESLNSLLPITKNCLPLNAPPKKKKSKTKQAKEVEVHLSMSDDSEVSEVDDIISFASGTMFQQSMDPSNGRNKRKATQKSVPVSQYSPNNFVSSGIPSIGNSNTFTSPSSIQSLHDLTVNRAGSFKNMIAMEAQKCGTGHQNGPSSTNNQWSMPATVTSGALCGTPNSPVALSPRGDMIYNFFNRALDNLSSNMMNRCSIIEKTICDKLDTVNNNIIMVYNQNVPNIIDPANLPAANDIQIEVNGPNHQGGLEAVLNNVGANELIQYNEDENVIVVNQENQSREN